MLRERWRSGSGESSDGIPRGPGGKSAPTKTSYEPIRDFGSTMAADIVFIVHPASANGRMRRRWKTYERAFRRELGPGFAVRTTDRAGHATHHTRAALGDGATTIVSVGGDGTFNEVVNGYLGHRETARNTDACLAVFSTGTGADFVRTLPVPATPAALARCIRERQPQTIDAGLCEFLDAGTRKERYFVNDVVVANGRYFGAGLMPAPAADLADGLLDGVIFGDVDFKTARRNLPALRRGER